MNDQEFLQDILTESDYLPDMTGAVENHWEGLMFWAHPEQALRQTPTKLWNTVWDPWNIQKQFQQIPTLYNILFIIDYIVAYV